MKCLSVKPIFACKGFAVAHPSLVESKLKANCRELQKYLAGDRAAEWQVKLSANKHKEEKI